MLSATCTVSTARCIATRVAASTDGLELDLVLATLDPRFQQAPLVLAARVADPDAEQEAVELRLGERYVPSSTHAEEGEEFARSPYQVYPLSKGVKNHVVLTAVGSSSTCSPDLPDPIPARRPGAAELLGLVPALARIHRPERKDWQQARRRLRFEEAFVLQVGAAPAARRAGASTATPRRPSPAACSRRSTRGCRSTLTDGQRRGRRARSRATWPATAPMHRLLQGEVGSGKTVVALRAMLAVVDAGGQAALLAPTEVLAAQHHRSIAAMLGDLAEAGMLGGAENATRSRC